jgi:hypothetical protein
LIIFLSPFMVATMQLMGVASISHYPGYNGSLDVTGHVAVGGFGDRLMMSWLLQGVEGDLCSQVPEGVANACGVHIHEGMTCSDASEVGGHYFDTDKFSSDPWAPKAYKASEQGMSLGMTSVQTGKTLSDVQGRAMVVHDHTGGRVGCGLIEAGMLDAAWKKISFQPYPGYTGDLKVQGEAFVWSLHETAWMQFGIAGVEDECKQTPEGVANACGIHIHEGKTCDDAAQVGGHFFDSSIANDPWAPQVYTTWNGAATGLFPTRIGTDDIAGRALVVHDKTGARVACGLIPASAFVV